MIDGYDNYQLELFSESKGGPATAPRRSRFFNLLRRYEKRTLLALGMAVICIVAFSWGVKRGREFSAVKRQPRFDLAREKTQEQVNPPQQRQVATASQFQIDSAGFTIQLASYKAKKTADSQAERLKKKGLAPIVLKKGDYIILCVGRFSDKGQAKDSLSKFKKEYKDCYLRRL